MNKPRKFTKKKKQFLQKILSDQVENDINNSNKQKNLLCTDFHAFYLQIRNMGWECFNDTHMEELVLY